MTKEEWKQIEEALKSLFSVVRIKADDYNVVLALVRVGTYKNAIMVYVDNTFQLSWMTEDCEERRRFFQRRERSLLSAKQKAEFKKLSRKRQKELADAYDRWNYQSYSPQWTSFGALKKHLIANNQQLELVSINGGGRP